MKTYIGVKMISLKKNIFIGFILLLALSGCKNEVTSPIIEDNNISAIKDTIENWSLGNKLLVFGLIDNITNEIYEYTTTTIDSIGIFNISLNNVIPSNLTSVREIQNLPISYLKISNPNVKGALGELLIFNPDTSKPSWLAACYSKIFLNNVGYFTIDYLYVEEDMDITGTFTGYGQVNGKNYTTIFQYDLHYKKGWNKIVITLVERTENGNDINEKYIFNHYEDGESQWIYWFINI
jgi:hypothetical protein